MESSLRRLALTLSALTATGLMLTACGGSSSSTPEADPQKVSSGQTITQFWPLTGLEVASGKSAELDHPVLVAKMDNTVSSQPQVGLSKADLVVEELVEGGLTRLAAFYYSDIPNNAGPDPVDARQRHPRGLAGARLDGDQRRRRPHDRADQGRGHPLLHRGVEGLLPLRPAPGALQPLRPSRRGRGDREGQAGDAPRLPDLGHRQGPAQGHQGDRASAPSSPVVTPPSGSSPTAATTT